MAFKELIRRAGRPRKYETPQELWDEFVAYCEFIDSHPLKEIDFRGANAVEVQLPKMRPYTKQAFALWAGLTEWRVVDSYKTLSEDFLQIVTRIDTCIFNQKLEGAASGFFNSSIIARDLGLVDKKEQEVNVKSMPDWMKDDEPESKVSKG